MNGLGFASPSLRAVESFRLSKKNIILYKNYFMTLEARKLDLIQRLTLVENEATLDIVEETLNADLNGTGWQLSDEQQQSLEKSLDHADAGQTTPHEVVMDRIKAKCNL